MPPPPPSLLSYVIITTMSNRNLPWADPKGSVRTEKWSTIKTSYLIKYFSERCRIANGVQWLQSFQFGGEPVRDYFSCAALISYRIFSLIYKKKPFFLYTALIIHKPRCKLWKRYEGKFNLASSNLFNSLLPTWVV